MIESVKVEFVDKICKITRDLVYFGIKLNLIL